MTSQLSFHLEWIGPSAACEGKMHRDLDGMWLVEGLIIDEQDGFDIASGEYGEAGRFDLLRDALDLVFEIALPYSSIRIDGIAPSEAAELLCESLISSEWDDEITINDEHFFIDDEGRMHRSE